MLIKIAEFERIFNSLLPVRRLDGRQSLELRNAALAWSQAVWKAGESLGTLPLSPEQIRSAEQLSTCPVFICGAHRSGTTLVRDLLDDHPALTVLPSEGSYLTSLVRRLKRIPEDERMAFMGREWLRRLVNPINQPPYWLLGRSSREGSPYVQFARQFLSWWDIENKSEQKRIFSPLIAVMLAYASCKDGINARYWVDKTPTNERFLAKLRKEMPEARIVHIIREPAEVFMSRKRMEPSLNIRTFLRDLKTS